MPETFSKPDESAASPASGQTSRISNRQWFWIGLGVRLAGVLCIWPGDGSDHILRKALVVVGVILMLGGITVLRWLLVKSLRRK